VSLPVWGTDRSDELGLRALDDPYATITRGQYDRARATNRELVAGIVTRLGPDAERIYRLSTAELELLADLERAST